VVLGLMQSLTSSASIVAPVFAGLLIEHGLLTLWAWAAAAAAAAGLFLAVLWRRAGHAPAHRHP
jgi:MFS family permease